MNGAAPRGSFFHHPRWSVPVVRRRTVDILVDMLGIYGDALATRGRSLLWQSLYESQKGYESAVHRLRKQGVIAYKSPANRTRILKLTEGGRLLSERYHPDRFWKRKWSGIWYVLMYDVEEDEKSFRDGLRRLLRRLRMGRLQKSVYITPRDIRPEYADLEKVYDMNYVSYLMETRMVLGQDPQEIVRRAWDWDAIDTAQMAYVEVTQDQTEWLCSLGPTAQEPIQTVAQEELVAYLTAVENDPFLPRSLWPPYYKGQRVYALHGRFVNAAQRALSRA